MYYIYAVYDSKAACYTIPRYFQTQAVAMRSWTASVNDEDGDFFRYAEDYTFFELGTYDDKTAKSEMHLTPISRGTALEHINNEIPTLKEVK